MYIINYYIIMYLAIRKCKRYNESWAVFQSHTYSRTFNLLDEFVEALLDFDNIIHYAFLVVLIIPVLFATIVLSMQNCPWPSNFLMAFVSSCLFIGILDGGMFATPSYVGIFGLYLVYRNGYYINYIIIFPSMNRFAKKAG